MPRLVKIRPKAEMCSVAHQPLIGGRLYLNGSVRILRINGVTANIQIQCAAGEVRTIHSETSAAGIRRLSPQLILIFARTKCRDDLKILFRAREFSGRSM